MLIGKGITGIRKIRTDNARGWHLFFDGKYATWADMRLLELVGLLPGYTVREIHGTALFIDTK